MDKQSRHERRTLVTSDEYDEPFRSPVSRHVITTWRAWSTDRRLFLLFCFLNVAWTRMLCLCELVGWHRQLLI